MSELITIRTSESTAEILPALFAASASVGKLTKDKDNPYFKSKYADLAQVCDTCIPALREHSIMVIHSGMISDQGTGVVCRLWHLSGEWLEGVMVMPLKDGSNPQAMGSSVTYGRRYLFMAMMCQVPEDDDGNAGAKPAPPKPEAAWLSVCKSNSKLAKATKALKMGRSDLDERWKLAKGNADKFTEDIIALAALSTEDVNDDE